MSWEAPGYVADNLLGFGASGEVWRGRDVTTGEVVALKRLRVGGDPTERDALRREAALLAAFRHPHVIGMRAAVCTRDGLVLVLDHAAGGSLGSLLARQGRLPADRVAAILADIAGALAAAHAVGLVHGDVSGGNVLLDGNGRPLLADLGTARLLAETGLPAQGTPGFADPGLAGGQPLTAASDVYALGALGALALAGPEAAVDPAAAMRSLPQAGPLAGLLGRMLRADAPARPSAADVVAQARAAGGAHESPWPVAPGWGAADGLSPQALTHAAGRTPAAEPPPVVSGRHRILPSADGRHVSGRRLAAVVLLAACAVAIAAVVGFRWGGRGVPQPAPTVAGSSPSWPQIWAGLDDRRARAFATGDAALLAGVYLPDCPALPPDLRAVRALAVRQVHAVGVRHQAASVRAESVAADTVTLLVTDRMAGYQVRDGADRLVFQAPRRGARSLRARLFRTDRGWRIAALTQA